MSADRDTMERPGTELVAQLPDAGPWQLFVYKGQAFALSQTSGLYAIDAIALRKIELSDGEKHSSARPNIFVARNRHSKNLANSRMRWLL